MSRIDNAIERWRRRTTSEVKLVRKEKNEIEFMLWEQKYKIIVPEEYPKGMVIIDYETIEKEYNFLMELRNELFIKRMSMTQILKRIDEESKKLRQGEIMDAVLFEETAEKIFEEFDIEEIRMERELRERIATMKSEVETGKKKVGRMFTGESPGTILINEMMKLRAKYKRGGVMEIKPVEMNIYHWKVLYKRFKNKEVRESLEKIERAHGYNYIEVDIKLNKEYYPSYPPFIKVVRPKLSGRLMEQVTRLRMVKFEYWMPSRSMEYVIERLHEILNEHARIRETEFNSLKMDTYMELEENLMKLVSLCSVGDELEELDEKKYARMIDISKRQALGTRSVQGCFGNQKQTKGESKFWKKGTGYGYTGAKKWNIDEYVKIQQEKDVDLQRVLHALIVEIQEKIENKDKMIYKIVKEAQMALCIKLQIKGRTLLDMDKRKESYKLIFMLLQNFITEEAMCIWGETSGGRTLYEELEDIVGQVRKMKELVPEKLEEYLRIIEPLYELVTPAYKLYIEEEQKRLEQELKERELRGTEKSMKRTYIEAMKKERYEMSELTAYTYKDEGKLTTQGIRRLGMEQGVLMTSLPITYESAILVRVDKKNMRRMRVMITGPDGTPYDSGIYLFDVYIECTYPKKPPMMRFINHGQKRLNPNLYDNGKVCLSLLGTWSGKGGETWNKKTSTLQQLFVSVQALILISMPVFNEPTHEESIGTSMGNIKNANYNQYIRYYTMCHAVYDIITNIDRYPEYAEAIKSHFRTKKEYILEEYGKWVEESYELSRSLQHNGILNKKRYEEKYNQIKQALDNLN